MDPLITNGIGPVMLRGLETRADERDPLPRRKRPVVRMKAGEAKEEYKQEPGFDIPSHKLDNLA